MIGLVFGRLTVESFHHKDAKYNKYWACRCVCGGSSVVAQQSLKSGATSSCGCLRKERSSSIADRALAEQRAYTRVSYSNMVKRCHKEYSTNYQRYGARGVYVCDRWRFGEGGLTGWQCFFLDVGPRPRGTTIDRIDNAKGYSPDNCRWATVAEQSANRKYSTLPCHIVRQ
jgi:hypothetical protein